MQCTSKDTGYEKLTDYRLLFENLHISVAIVVYGRPTIFIVSCRPSIFYKL